MSVNTAVIATPVEDVQGDNRWMSMVSSRSTALATTLF